MCLVIKIVFTKDGNNILFKIFKIYGCKEKTFSLFLKTTLSLLLDFQPPPPKLATPPTLAATSSRWEPTQVTHQPLPALPHFFFFGRHLGNPPTTYPTFISEKEVLLKLDK